VEQSLRDLKLDVIDVLLLHWPPGDDPVEPSLALLQEAHRLGYARHVGVSNYTAAMMRTALSVMDIPIVVNQVEFHPLINQAKLLAASAETGIPFPPTAPSRVAKSSNIRVWRRLAGAMRKLRRRWRCGGFFKKASR
jgi:diketogulonate reductase-like aldo/keto reductase